VINSENFRSLNDQLRQNHILVQGYGVRQPGEIFYESFPMDQKALKGGKIEKCKNQRALDKLSNVLNLKEVCGYIIWLKTGVPDLGSEDFSMDVCLQRPKAKKPGRVVMVDESARPSTLQPITKDISFQDLQSPLDSTDIITNFDKSSNATVIDGSFSSLKSPNEQHFASTPIKSPSNDFRSADCNKLLEQEIDESGAGRQRQRVDDDERRIPKNMVSQSSIEIELDASNDPSSYAESIKEEEYLGEVIIT
jgi:hypothetical protein